MPGADYFLTICVERPASNLADSAVAAELFAQADRMENEGNWTSRSAVIMPDHLHLVVTLRTGTLAAAVRLFKGRSAGALRRAELHWQPSFFDHRLRASDELPSIFRYIQLNPYRSRLLPFTEAWPAYRCCPEDWAWFEPTTNNGLPWPEWADADPPVPGASAGDEVSGKSGVKPDLRRT